ncbi:hypothetical protein GLW36_09220 [Halorubrum terrestre]|uniref:DUF1102 domain-containing protein n=2 Tax=Halorubrum distributum TaxID=29283 RepID=A0A6B1I7R1_9EURY|nr:hypothetical protein [Halorubrum terrestre]
MTNRRKFLAGVGALATGSAAAVGTGAFTSVSANRTVNVALADDSNAFVGLEPGDSELVVQSGSTLQVNLDGTGADGSGANMDAVTTIGDPDNPQTNHAFKIIHQGTQPVLFKMNYYITNTGWIQNNGNGQSHMTFEVFGDGGSTAENYPHQSYNNDFSLGQPNGSGFGESGTPYSAPNRGDGYRFNPGDEYYMVMSVNTTGSNASKNDDLSGTAVLEPATSTSQDKWDPKNPPSL